MSRCVRVRVAKLEARKLHSSVTLNTGSAIKLKYRRTVFCKNVEKKIDHLCSIVRSLKIHFHFFFCAIICQNNIDKL